MMGFFNRRRAIYGKHDYCSDIVEINNRRESRGLSRLPCWLYDVDLYCDKGLDINLVEYTNEDLRDMYRLLSPHRQSRLRNRIKIWEKV